MVSNAICSSLLTLQRQGACFMEKLLNCMSPYHLLMLTIVFLFIYLLFYVAFNSQGHIAMGSLQVEETSAYCTINHRASASNYQLSNIKRPAQDSNRRPQRLEARILTATPPSPLIVVFLEQHYIVVYLQLKPVHKIKC